MKDQPIKVNYKDVGTCLRFINGKQIFRSKYKTESDAQHELDSMKYLNVVNPLSVVYQCPECKMWHVGLKEWQNK